MTKRQRFGGRGEGVLKVTASAWWKPTGQSRSAVYTSICGVESDGIVFARWENANQPFNGHRSSTVRPTTGSERTVGTTPNRLYATNGIVSYYIAGPYERTFAVTLLCRQYAHVGEEMGRSPVVEQASLRRGSSEYRYYVD